MSERDLRVKATYAPKFDKFILKDYAFTQQFNHIYSQRLARTKDSLKYRGSHHFNFLITIVMK